MTSNTKTMIFAPELSSPPNIDIQTMDFLGAARVVSHDILIELTRQPICPQWAELNLLAEICRQKIYPDINLVLKLKSEMRKLQVVLYQGSLPAINSAIAAIAECLAWQVDAAIHLTRYLADYDAQCGLMNNTLGYLIGQRHQSTTWEYPITIYKSPGTSLRIHGLAYLSRTTPNPQCCREQRFENFIIVEQCPNCTTQLLSTLE